MKTSIINELEQRTKQSNKLLQAYSTNPSKASGEMESRAKFLNSEIERLSNQTAPSTDEKLNEFIEELDQNYPKVPRGFGSRVAYYNRSSKELSKLLKNETNSIKRNAIVQRINELEANLAEELRLEDIIHNTPVDLNDKSFYHSIDLDRSISRGSGALYRDANTGQLYRALNHGEKLTRNSEDYLSPGKYLKGCLTGDWTGAESELRAFSGNLGTSGGFLIPEVLSSMFIDVARNQSRVIQAGAQTISVPSRDVVIAKVTKDASTSYKQENEAATDNDMEFGYITLQSRTLVSYATISHELLQDATANLDQIVMNAFGEAISLEMDRAALFGSGVAGRPLGLYNYNGIGIVSPNVNGFNISNYDEFSEAIQDIENANGTAKAAIFSPRTAAQLRELKEATTNAYLSAPSFFTDLKRLTTNQVPNNLTYGTATDASAAFIGDFSQVLFAVRQNLRIETSNHAGEAWQRYQFKIRATLRYDIAVLRPSHFSVIKGIKG